VPHRRLRVAALDDGGRLQLLVVGPGDASSVYVGPVRADAKRLKTS
jgi:hypothetical protein